MLCDVCKSNQASVFLTQIVEGKLQKVNLCEACSKEKGVTDPTGFALADLLLGMGSAQEIEKVPAVQRCSVCGFTQNDFKKTGRLGCPSCYETFAPQLESVIEQMHKGTQHVGKIPARLFRSLQLDTEMKSLHEGLRKAVAEENYESAAEIRDQIKHLEAQLKS